MPHGLDVGCINLFVLLEFPRSGFISVDRLLLASDGCIGEE